MYGFVDGRVAQPGTFGQVFAGRGALVVMLGEDRLDEGVKPLRRIRARSSVDDILNHQRLAQSEYVVESDSPNIWKVR